MQFLVAPTPVWMWAAGKGRSCSAPHFPLRVSGFSLHQGLDWAVAECLDSVQKGGFSFPWVRATSLYSWTTARSGASIANPTKSVVKQSSQVLHPSGLLTLILQWLCSDAISNCFLFCLLINALLWSRECDLLIVRFNHKTHLQLKSAFLEYLFNFTALNFVR